MNLDPARKLFVVFMSIVCTAAVVAGLLTLGRIIFGGPKP